MTDKWTWVMRLGKVLTVGGIFFGTAFTLCMVKLQSDAIDVSAGGGAFSPGNDVLAILTFFASWLQFYIRASHAATILGLLLWFGAWRQHRNSARRQVDHPGTVTYGSAQVIPADADATLRH